MRSMLAATLMLAAVAPGPPARPDDAAARPAPSRSRSRPFRSARRCRRRRRPRMRWRRRNGWRCNPTSPGSASITARSPATSASAWSTRSRNTRRPTGGKPTGVLNPQERAVLAETARRKQENVGWKIATDPGTGVRLGIPTKLVPQQASDANGAKWTSPTGTVQVLAGRRKEADPDHRKTRRAGEEGTGRTQDRLHRGQAGLLRAVRPAGPEEILPARHLQGRRSPHHDHPLRSGDREHRRAGRDRDVERVQCVSDRGASGRAAAAQDRRIRHRHRRQRRRRDRHRPPGHRRLPRDHDRGYRQCRSSRRGQGARSRAAAHLWRARPEAAQSRQAARRRQRSTSPALPIRRTRAAAAGASAASRRRWPSSTAASDVALSPAPAVGFSGVGRARWRRQVRRHRAVEAGAWSRGRRTARRRRRRCWCRPIRCAIS